MTKKLQLRIVIPVIMLFVSISSFAQHVELTAFGGGTFAAGINNYSTNYYKAQIGGSAHFGGALDFFLKPNSSVNLTVSNQPTTGYLFGQGSNKTISAPMSMTYMLLGINRYVGDKNIKGYGGIGL